MNRNGLHRATEAPCAVFMDMAYEVPKSYTKSRKAQCYSQQKQPGKPDADNVAKAILDAMNGIVYEDDRRAVFLHIVKRYAIEGEEAGVTVTVIPLNNPSALNGILEPLIEFTFSQ